MSLLARSCLALSLLVGARASAASIYFNGAVTSATGPFAPTNPIGQSVTGTIDFGSGIAFGPSAGSYLMTTGVIQLNFGGVPSTPINASTSQVVVNVEDSSSGADRLQILTVLGGVYDLRLDFVGNSNMLTSAAFPSAASIPNWSHFSGGLGILAAAQLIVVNPSIIVATAGPGDEDELRFEITSVGDVPEPMTLFSVPLGFGLLLWRRQRP